MERYGNLQSEELTILLNAEFSYLISCDFSDLDSLKSFIDGYDAYSSIPDSDCDALHAALSSEELPFDEDSFQRIVAHYDNLLVATFGLPNPN